MPSFQAGVAGAEPVIESNLYACRFCNVAFQTHYELGGHASCCRRNPKFDDITQKRSLARKKQVLHTFVCKFCNCTVERFATAKQYAKLNPVYCSRSCANRNRCVSAETRKKIASRLRKPAKVDHVACKICGSEFERAAHHRTNTCSKECKSRLLSLCVKGKTGGYRTKSGLSKFHGSTYRGIWMDSSWELRLAMRMDLQGITWIRSHTNTLPYVDDEGVQRHYIPDFFLPERNVYVEVKGYWTSKNRNKLQAVLRHNAITLVVLDSLTAIDSFT